MNKSNLSTDIALALMTCIIACCSPCQAHGQKNKPLNDANSRVTGSLYCVQGKVTVKGWERELIARDPSLAKFHWSPITAARPGKIYFRQPISVNGSKPFRTLKPQLVSTESALQVQAKRDQGKRRDCTGGSGRANINRTTMLSARLGTPAAAYTGTYAFYSTTPSCTAQMPDYRTMSSTNRPKNAYRDCGEPFSSGSTARVQGRLISAK